MGVAKNDKLAAQESLPLQAGSAGHDRVEANTACRTWQPPINVISFRPRSRIAMSGTMAIRKPSRSLRDPALFSLHCPCPPRAPALSGTNGFPLDNPQLNGWIFPLHSESNSKLAIVCGVPGPAGITALRPKSTSRRTSPLVWTLAHGAVALGTRAGIVRDTTQDHNLRREDRTDHGARQEWKIRRRDARV